MTNEELIARLRESDKTKHGYYGYVRFNRDGLEAADRIEALTKQVREMAMQSLSDLGQAQDAYEELVAERAKVAKLVEALEYYAGRVTYRLCDDCPVQVHKSADLSGPARAALTGKADT